VLIGLDLQDRSIDDHPKAEVVTAGRRERGGGHRAAASHSHDAASCDGQRAIAGTVRQPNLGIRWVAITQIDDDLRGVMRLDGRHQLERLSGHGHGRRRRISDQPVRPALGACLPQRGQFRRERQ
jgi:hypothetical protein